MKLLKNYELNNVSGGWTKLEVIKNGEEVICTNPRNPVFLLDFNEALTLIENKIELEEVLVNGVYFGILIKNVAYRCLHCPNSPFIVEKLLGKNAKKDLRTLVLGN